MKNPVRKRRGHQMAIQPIDLQAIFSQMDKVGKIQASLRDGQQLQDSLNQANAQRKLEENIKSVNETQNMGDESGKIKDENRKGAHHEGAKGKAHEEAEDVVKEKKDLLRDPALGRNLDISG